MSHDHNHGATAAGQHRGRLAVVLSISVSVMIAEVVGSAISGSGALLADAGHMLTDSVGVLLALIAATLAQRPPSPSRTFGLARLEVLAALANGVILTVVAVLVTVEAVQRLIHPIEVATTPMLSVAVVGLAANVIGILLLRAGQRVSLNVRGAYLEVLGDLVGSIAVIVAGVIILVTGFQRADGIASLAIAALIAPRAVGLLRQVGHVLLEGTPRETDLETVRSHLREQDGVREVHDLHAWTITSGQPVLTAHIVVDEAVFQPDRYHALLDGLQECATGHFDLEHSTFQIEPERHEGSEPLSHA